jgi:hypothetical protein
VFGREGYALPLGPIVQHTGEIDPVKPLAALYLFGKPAQPLDGFTQARITVTDGRVRVAAAATVKVEPFGDATGVPVETLP